MTKQVFFLKQHYQTLFYRESTIEINNLFFEWVLVKAAT